MQIPHSSLIITFIQLSTHNDSFSLAPFNLIFFCLCIGAGFHLTFLYSVDFLVLSQILTPVLTHFFHLFCCTFFIFKAYYFGFSIKRLWYLLWSTSMFTIFNHPISFIFAPDFRHSWLRTMSFTTLHYGLLSWRSFTVFSIVSIDSSFVGAMSPFIKIQARIGFNCRLMICISRLLLVFVIGIQITRSIHNFFLNIRFFHIFLCMAWKQLYNWFNWVC